MFIPEPFRQPHYRHRLQTCGVSQQLSEMIVVGLFELVLDQHQGISPHVPANDVGAERTYLFFDRPGFQFEPKRFTEYHEVFQFGEPRCEFGRLIRPDLAELDAQKAPKRLNLQA